MSSLQSAWTDILTKSATILIYNESIQGHYVWDQTSDSIFENPIVVSKSKVQKLLFIKIFITPNDYPQRLWIAGNYFGNEMKLFFAWLSTNLFIEIVWSVCLQIWAFLQKLFRFCGVTKSSFSQYKQCEWRCKFDESSMLKTVEINLC